MLCFIFFLILSCEYAQIAYPHPSNVPESAFDLESDLVPWDPSSPRKRAPATAPTVDDCCPSVSEIIQTQKGGVHGSGRILELYRDGNTTTQSFYQITCAQGVKDKPCRYVTGRDSKCVQRYSYSYALVRELARPNAQFRLDHIRIRSGCTCEVTLG